MYDTRFTAKKVIRTDEPNKKFRQVTTPEGKTLCEVSDACICDLNGQEIAAFSHTEKVVENGEKITARIYTSSYGEFIVKGNYLYLGKEFLGTMPPKKRRAALIFLTVTGLLLAAAILIISLIDLPYDEPPIIDVRDDNGDWKAQGTVAVLDEVIHPDTSGEYYFIIRNANNVKLLYEFSIGEFYNGEPAESFPLEYRVRVNNDMIGSGEWLSASELHFKDLVLMEQSDYLVTLEWRWPFESGNDELDTDFGKVGGLYSLDLTLTAESISEIN